MKIAFKLSYIFSIVVLLLSCATTSSRSALSLHEAIEQSAEKIATDLPEGSVVAVVNFGTNNKELSNYIIGELNGALLDYGIRVVTRNSLEYVEKEQNFQLSGAVNDETIQGVGHFFGAEVIVVGELTEMGRMYRYRTEAIYVKEARQGSIVRLDVQNDRAMQRVVSAITNQKMHVKTENEIAEQTRPSTALDFLERGIILAMRGEYDLAIMNFSDAIELNSSLLGAYMLRGRALLASGVSALMGVGDNFGSIETGFSNYEAFVGAYGVSAERHAIYNSAIENFTQAIKLSPNPARAYLERGMVYFHIYDYDNAITDFSQAIRFDPNNSSAYEKRGITLYRRYSNNSINHRSTGDDLNRVITDLTQAINLNLQDKSAVYMVRGWAYEQRSSKTFDTDADLAIADFETMLKIDPSDKDAINGLLRIYSNRAGEYAFNKDYDRAIALVETVLRMDIDEDDRESFEEFLEDIKQEQKR